MKAEVHGRIQGSGFGISLLAARRERKTGKDSINHYVLGSGFEDTRENADYWILGKRDPILHFLAATDKIKKLVQTCLTHA